MSPLTKGWRWWTEKRPSHYEFRLEVHSDHFESVKNSVYENGREYGLKVRLDRVKSPDGVVRCIGSISGPVAGVMRYRAWLAQFALASLQIRAF